MCGIAGIWGVPDKKIVNKMLDTMVHRGPNSEGFYNSLPGTLGHRRLSIMDPSGGRQPIYNEDHTKTIVANGEIYNFYDLRKGLGVQHKFQTQSDTEAILHLYEELDISMVQKLDGMFTIAISDGKDLFLARDPIGIKPLYYGTKNKALIFASELKALSGIATDVKEFPPGVCYHSKIGFRPYYTVPDSNPRNLSLETHLKYVRETIEHSVTKRLMSDVPLGAFLSGGLDSSIIAAIARQHVEKLHTFSVGIEGSHDLEAAQMVARHLGTIHHEYILTSDEVMGKLPEIIYDLESFDQDLVRSAIPCYFVSRLAADYVKVILTGEGADELFAGYNYYRNIHNPEHLSQELRRSVNNLHNVNLQRVDRMTMAHSIEGRVPFLDTEMIELALSIPIEWKLYLNRDKQITEKWILRKACEDLLPPKIVWRDKEQFDEGSGIINILTLLEDKLLSLKTKTLDIQPKVHLRSAEERTYYNMLNEVYSNSEVIIDNVARWSERP